MKRNKERKNIYSECTIRNVHTLPTIITALRQFGRVVNAVECYPISSQRSVGSNPTTVMIIFFFISILNFSVRDMHKLYPKKNKKPKEPTNKQKKKKSKIVFFFFLFGLAFITNFLRSGRANIYLTNDILRNPLYLGTIVLHWINLLISIFCWPQLVISVCDRVS